MKKILLLTTVAAGALLLSGCMQPPANTNTNVVAVNMNYNSSSGTVISGNLNANRTAPNVTPEASIRVTTPAPNAVVTNGYEVSGQAAGWYFEAAFGLTVVDANGKELYNGAVTATDDWMTASFVPFSGKVTFAKPETTTGKFIFQRSNPSGLPEFEERFEVPVQFGAWQPL